MIFSVPSYTWHLWNICVTNDHGYVPLAVNTSLSVPHSWLITGCVTRLTRRCHSVTWTAYPSGAPELTPGLNGVRVTRSLVLCVCFVDCCLSFCSVSVGHCVVCSSSLYGFWLPLCHLQSWMNMLTKLTSGISFTTPYFISWQRSSYTSFHLVIIVKLYITNTSPVCISWPMSINVDIKFSANDAFLE